MRRLSILLFFVSVVATTLYGHHGRGATYDMKKRITLKGTVARVDWRNPHVVIWMDVKDETGKVVTWGFENAGVSQLAQEGDRKSTRLNSSHTVISYAVFCLKKKTQHTKTD